MKIFHNTRCRKSREALSILRDNGFEPDIIDYLKEVPTKEELQKVVQLLGISAKDLVRKGETIYKENYKNTELSEEAWIDVMLADPKLIERPIIIKGSKAVIGRSPEKILSLL